MAKVTILFGSETLGEVNLDKDEMRAGRAQDCDIHVDNMGVSRHHCSLVRRGDNWAVIDQGSNNGTFVDGKAVSEHTLNDQDRIMLGKHCLVFDAFGYANDDQREAERKRVAA